MITAPSKPHVPEAPDQPVFAPILVRRMKAKRFFFILAMPRSRSAWLSILLSSGLSSCCWHEGTVGHQTLESYAEALRARPELAVGDSNSLLAFHVSRLLAEFPDASWAVVRRDPDDALASLEAAEPEEAARARSWWPGYLDAFESAAAALTASGKLVMEVDFRELADSTVCQELTARLLGRPADLARIEKLQQLRVTLISDARSDEFSPLPAELPVVMQPEFSKPVPLTIDRLRELGVDVSGLSVRHYGERGDYDLVNAWWMARYGTLHPFRETTLPPLGVIVEKDGEPAGALWCYESFGIGIGHLEYPVTRPGLGMKEAFAVLAFAVTACVTLAGQGCSPPGQFSMFRVSTLPALARGLRRLGFMPASEGPRENLVLIAA